MIATILGLIASLVKFGSTALDWLWSKKLMDSGAASESNKTLKQQLDNIEKSLSAREEIRKDLTKNPDKVDDEDEFMR
jgi:hypothetical protein